MIWFENSISILYTFFWRTAFIPEIFYVDYYRNVTKHYIAFYIYLGHLPGANPNLHFTKQLELKLKILIKLYTKFPLLLK